MALAAESQSDFTGGENSSADKTMLRPNQVSKAKNVYHKRGGGLKARKGYKVLGIAPSGQGRYVAEFEQTTGQLLTYVSAGTTWYDETMQPGFRLFNQTPGTNDAFYAGSRAKFNLLQMNMIYAYAAPGNVFTWYVSDGAGGWIDKTSLIVESVANAKQMRGAIGTWIFAWPDFSDWLPQQVETRGYQYWLYVKCTTGGTNGGSDVFHGQTRMTGDWLGQRKIAMFGTSSQIFSEIVGFTLTPPSVSIPSWITGQAIDRFGGVMLNDYFYFHSNGQRPLLRWNGCRGTTRSGASNNPTSAGLSAPAAPTLATAGVAGYQTGVVLRYRVSRLYGPAGILGEGPPSPSVEITIPGGGPYQVNVTITGLVTSAGATDVSGFKIYVTNDLVNVDASERDFVDQYLLIATVNREDATWVSGVLADTKLPHQIAANAHPIAYTGTPPINPSLIALGGERLWIANNHFVYASDIRRGDSFDPEFGFEFPQITGILWWNEVMLVFGPERIWAIRGINDSLPKVEDFYVGLGNVQPDSLTVGDGAVYFCSRLGPARITRENGVERLGTGRVWESSNYWGETMGESRIAQGAFFEKRWWIPIDDNSTNSPLTTGRIAVFDTADGEWSFMQYRGAGSATQGFGGLGVVHGTLDHPLKNKLVMLGFPDGAIAAEFDDLDIMEYGTTDQWVTDQFDGQEVLAEIDTRALVFGSIQRTKDLLYGHARIKFPYSDVANKLSIVHLGDISTAVSTTLSFAGRNTGGSYVDVKWEPTVSSSGGKFSENASVLQFTVAADSGFELLGWWVAANVQEFNVGIEV